MGAQIVTLRPGKFSSYKEVTLEGGESIDLYKEGLDKWIHDQCMNDIFDLQENRGEDYGISDAISELSEAWWNDDSKLIEYAKFELGV